MASRFSYPKRIAACAAAFVAICATSLTAQGTGVIRGRVTESGGRGLADVQVNVMGTNLGAVTSATGDYVLSSVPAGQQTIAVRRLGYTRATKRVQLSTGGDERVDFQLGQAVSQLEAVVTTGTAGAVEKRTVGNAITQVDVSGLTEKTNIRTVTEALQNGTPGVTIAPGAGTPGAASDIVIRGYSSFTANRPVVFIDGVRVHTDSLFNFTPSGAGNTPFSGQRTSALDIINPDDIESMEILKGPAASTLYGADAAAGVIQIITKKGMRGQQRNRWTVRGEAGSNSWGSRTLTNYTLCTTALINQVDAAGNPVFPGCRAAGVVADQTVLTDQPFVRDPLAMRDGGIKKLAVSLRGGADRYSYYLSGENSQEEGIQLNSFNSTRSVRTNFSFSPVQAADVQLSFGYLRNSLRLPLGDEAANGLMLSASRGRPGRAVNNPAQSGWATSFPAQANRYNNRTRTDRFTLSTTANYTPFTWLRNRATLGFDLNSGFAQILSLPGEIDVPLGFVGQRVPRVFNYTLDYNGNVDYRVRPDLLTTTSVGVQLTANRTELLTATGTELPPGGISRVGLAVTTTGDNAFSEFNSIGQYIQEQLSWRDRMYLTGAVRIDAHSSFGANADYIAYPKASLSWVLSEEPALADIFSAARAENLRLRFAWGKAGRAPQPFFANPTYTADRVAVGTGVSSALRTLNFGNPDLKPEEGSEIELGFDSDFLKSRLGVEFTYYNKTMSDLIVGLAVPPSLGFPGTRLTNVGKTRNTGTETALRLVPLSLDRFQWDANVGLAFNTNKLLFLDPNRSEELLGGLSYTPGMQRNRVGMPMGAFLVQMPARKANGDFIFTDSLTTRRTLLLESDTAGTCPGATCVITPRLTFKGTPVPRRTITVGNNFTVFKNVRFYAMIDHQGGFTQMNYKEYNRCALQNNCKLFNDPTADTTLRRVRAAANSQPLYLEPGDFTKLRDVSISYDLPAVWASRLKASAATFTLAGHNLKTWTDYTGLDPEVNEYSNATNRGVSPIGRADAYSMPPLKRVSFMLNLVL